MCSRLPGGGRLRWLLEDAKAWAADDDQLPLFEPLMIEDRLAPSYDADGHGVVRSVVIWGKLACDGGVSLTVEFSWHVKMLYALKKKLSNLYEGRRALGADTDAVATHDGALDHAALDRATKGIVTRLRCAEMPEAMSGDVKDALCALLHSESCRLTELDLTGSAGAPPTLVSLTGAGEKLQCVRLRSLKLAKLKLAGEIPPAISRCRWLTTLELQDNQCATRRGGCFRTCDALPRPDRSLAVRLALLRTG